MPHQKWEYLIYLLSDDDVESDGTVAALTALGEQGWDAVGIAGGADEFDSAKILLKRPKSN